MSRSKDNIFFLPNVSVKLQISPQQAASALDELLVEGIVEKVKVPKYRNETMSDFAVSLHQDFDWDNLQDPEDFMPLTIDDIEVTFGYRQK